MCIIEGLVASLPSGEGNYTLSILDTWEMEVLEEKTIAAGTFKYITEQPYIALKILRK